MTAPKVSKGKLYKSQRKVRLTQRGRYKKALQKRKLYSETLQSEHGQLRVMEKCWSKSLGSWVWLSANSHHLLSNYYL